MTKPATTEHKGRRRARWKISAALLLLALMGLGIVASMRRTWRTVRLSPGNGGSALIVEVPPGWEGISEVEVPPGWEGISEDDTHSYLTVIAPRSTGLFCWWDEHVRKMDMREWKFESITISIRELPATTSDVGIRELNMVQQRMAATERRLFRNVKTTQITQPDLIGFEMEASGYVGSFNIGNGRELTALLNHYDPVRRRSTMITLQAPPEPRNFPALKPTMDEIIRRLRLVQEK